MDFDGETSPLSSSVPAFIQLLTEFPYFGDQCTVVRQKLGSCSNRIALDEFKQIVDAEFSDADDSESGTVSPLFLLDRLLSDASELASLVARHGTNTDRCCQ